MRRREDDEDVPFTPTKRQRRGEERQDDVPKWKMERRKKQRQQGREV